MTETGTSTKVQHFLKIGTSNDKYIVFSSTNGSALGSVPLEPFDDSKKSSLFPSGRPLAVRSSSPFGGETQCHLVKQMDMHSELWELMQSPKENLWEQRAGKYAHHTHATVAPNVVDGGIVAIVG